MKITQPALRYFGGKWKIAKWIIQHFPAHYSYVEPFGGGASVLLRKGPSQLETYNDLESGVVSFFRVLRNRPDELIDALRLTPYSREEFMQSLEPVEDELERARRFYVFSWQGRGRGGNIQVGGWRAMKTDSRGKTPAEDFTRLDVLYAIAERLRKVQIEQMDALECIRAYDDEKTLFYVDPPYILPDGRKDGYLMPFGDDDHIRLAEVLNNLKGMAIISGYKNALYDELFNGWMHVCKRAQKDSPLDFRVDTVESLWLSPHVKNVRMF